MYVQKLYNSSCRNRLRLSAMRRIFCLGGKYVKPEEKIIQAIQQGQTSLGIEFGSTRIKAVLIDSAHETIASGSYSWENQLIAGFWTYSLEDIWKGLQESYQALTADVTAKYGVPLTTIGTIGFSGMMHGYLAFDKDNQLLVPFRTWRNATTAAAEEKLTDVFNYNIPQRWSIAHLYQAILDQEAHVEKVTFFTTLAGYVHWQLTGEKVIGIGDASGMFPIDTQSKNYDSKMLAQFDQLVADQKYPWQLSELLPEIRLAGQTAGYLTEAGAKQLDVSGQLQAGIPLCPPEGDAGTGMVATNSVAKRTGNVSAGTSVFAMIVLEQQLSKVYSAIDLVTTPTGDLVGMVHANNCSSDINAWVNLFKEFALLTGHPIASDQLFEQLFMEALKGDPECGGLLSYGYYSGENITGISEGRPLFVRKPESHFTLANFMRVHLFSALGALKIGMDILVKEEQVKIDKILGHGGLFKTKEVGQKIMAAAMATPVTVLETAGEGGAWGIALLAAYSREKQATETLADYLAKKVFAQQKGLEVIPDQRDIDGFETFIQRYQTGLELEQLAVDVLK